MDGFSHDFCVWITNAEDPGCEVKALRMALSYYFHHKNQSNTTQLLPDGERRVHTPAGIKEATEAC